MNAINLSERRSWVPKSHIKILVRPGQKQIENSFLSKNLKKQRRYLKA